MVVPLTPEDLDAAIETLTTAFCRDPMYVALIEDERARRPWVQFLMAGLVRPRGPRALWVGVDGGRRGALYATPSDHVSRIGAFAGLVGPIRSRQRWMASSPSSTIATIGPSVMKRTRSPKKGRSAWTW